MMSYRFRVTVVLILAAASLTRCNEPRPATVTSYYGPATRVKGLGQTFAWSPHAMEPNLGTPEHRELVRESIERHLAEKGYSQAPAREASFWARYRVSRRAATDATVATHGEVIEKGSLVVEALDPSTGEWIWRGVAQARLEDTEPPDVRGRRLEDALNRMFEQFPAK